MTEADAQEEEANMRERDGHEPNSNGCAIRKRERRRSRCVSEVGDSVAELCVYWAGTLKRVGLFDSLNKVWG